MGMNANIPPISCFVRSSFLRNLEPEEEIKSKYPPVFDCLIFGVASVSGKPPLFHFKMRDGGLWWRMPIHAFCTKPDAPQRKLHDLVLWDCFSHHVEPIVFSMLSGQRMKIFAPNSKSKEMWGKYLFTLDWSHPNDNVLDTGFSEDPVEHKCGHVIELDDGNIAIQPNNRVLNFDSSFTDKFGDLQIERKSLNVEWTAENHVARSAQWGKFHYDIEETPTD